MASRTVAYARDWIGAGITMTVVVPSASVRRFPEFCAQERVRLAG